MREIKKNILNTSSLVKKICYNANISDIEKKQF